MTDIVLAMKKNSPFLGGLGITTKSLRFLEFANGSVIEASRFHHAAALSRKRKRGGFIHVHGSFLSQEEFPLVIDRSY